MTGFNTDTLNYFPNGTPYLPAFQTDFTVNAFYKLEFVKNFQRIMFVLLVDDLHHRILELWLVHIVIKLLDITISYVMYPVFMS